MNEQLSLIYGYLHGMWSYRWTALIISWVIAVSGWIYVIAMPDLYGARAVVYIDTTSVMQPLLKGLALETDTHDEIKVMSRVLLSRDNLLTVMRETDMDLEAETPEARENLVNKLASSILVKGGGAGKRDRSNIYEISYYENAPPERVYQVVSKLLNTMIEGTLSSSRTDTLTAQKFIDGQIEEYEQRLTIAEQRLAEFKKANVGYMPDETGGYYARLQRAQDAVENTRSALSLAERKFSELSKQLGGEKPLLDGDSYGAATIIKIRQYQEQLNNLLNQFTEQHPDVQALRSTIDSLSAKLDTDNPETSPTSGGGGDNVEFNPVYQAMRVDLSKAGVEVEALKTQLLEHQARVENLKNSIDIIPEVEAKLSKLNRDYEVTHGRYLNLVERREAARLAQSAGQSSSDITFRVIEPPIVPSQPSGPNRLLLMTGVLLASLAAGLGVSLLQYLLKPTFVDPQQVRLRTGLPVLGSVSLHLSLEHSKKRRMQLASFLSAIALLVCIYGITMLNVL